MKGNQVILIRINAAESDHRSTKVSGDIFDDGVGIGKIGLGIDIKAMLVFFVKESFGFSKRGADAGLQKVEESGLEGFS